MCLESFVAIMALIAACTLEPGVYLSMNVKGDAAATVAKVTALGFPVSLEHMTALANQIGEKTLFGRVGGAPTLAVGMANIFSKVFGSAGLGLWYHFAIMFEALFILTTLDAGTRVGRYLLQDFLGHLWKPLGDTKKFGANCFASALMVMAWGYFLIQGVRDPLGGINSLWPLFGIANQMLAAIALCLAVTIILKMQLTAGESKVQSPSAFAKATADRKSKAGRPALALIAFVPLVWLLAVTMTAGVEKIWHPNPKIGFLAQAGMIEQQLPELEHIHARALQDFVQTAIKFDHSSPEFMSAQAKVDDTWAPVARLRTLRFNNQLDALVAGTFLFLVSAIFLMSLREWLLLIAGKKAADLRETPPTWLPDYALARSKPFGAVALLALAFALVKELSGEAELHRAHDQACAQAQKQDDTQIYVQTTEQRFNGVKRCC
jgi:carbon starvation protein